MDTLHKGDDDDNNNNKISEASRRNDEHAAGLTYLTMILRSNSIS